MDFLSIENLEVHYGVIRAIDRVSFSVQEGEIVTLIGANGAGKSSIIQAILGMVKKSGGQVNFCGRDITHLPTHTIASLGITEVPEGRRTFNEMTVYENLLLGAYLCKDRKEIKRRMEEVFRHFPRLQERKRQTAGTLSGGEQQMLAMGRAMMAAPKIVLLDEPSMGLSPLLVDEVFQIIKSWQKEGMTILLVEQNAKKSLEISDRAYVLENGHIVLSGTGKELLTSDDVKKAYLGG